MYLYIFISYYKYVFFYENNCIDDTMDDTFAKIYFVPIFSVFTIAIRRSNKKYTYNYTLI